MNAVEAMREVLRLERQYSLLNAAIREMDSGDPNKAKVNQILESILKRQLDLAENHKLDLY